MPRFARVLTKISKYIYFFLTATKPEALSTYLALDQSFPTQISSRLGAQHVSTPLGAILDRSMIASIIATVSSTFKRVRFKLVRSKMHKNKVDQKCVLIVRSVSDRRADG